MKPIDSIVRNATNSSLEALRQAIAGPAMDDPGKPHVWKIALNGVERRVYRVIGLCPFTHVRRGLDE